MSDIFIYEPADYPHEWTSEQRLSAYWHAIKTDTRVENTNRWYDVLRKAEDTAAQQDSHSVEGLIKSNTDRPPF